MLEELSVHNYAIIEQIRVRFSRGLNVLSGETGAGKSILVGALGLLLGFKADAESIRSGAEEMSVSGIIRLGGNAEALSWLEERGVHPEEGAIIIRRVVKASGKSSIFVQSEPFTQAALRELAALLFDMHGQHEHQSLLNTDVHRRLLDRYGGCEEAVTVFSDLYARLVKVRERYASLVEAEKDRLRKMDLLQFSIQEIQQAQLAPGEDEGIAQELKILTNYEKLYQAVEEAYASGTEGLKNLRQAKQMVEEAGQIDAGLQPLFKQLEDAFYEVEDFAESLGRYRCGIHFDPQRLESLQERLVLINRLKKKYGDTIEEILSHLKKCQEELGSFENWEEEKGKLEAEISLLETELRGKAQGLSQKRREAATGLQAEIEEELKQLGMPKVSFKVDVQEKENEAGRPVYTPTGKDRVEFLISPNLGEPFKKLVQIASGGEISRVMLAIKSVLAASDSIGSLIFDEVDAGIGGEVALAVGERLKKLSALKQILCITHLATIAVRADTHIKVEKINRDGRTFAVAEAVSGAERREEIARMLSGDRTGEVSLRHADELLKKYGA